MKNYFHSGLDKFDVSCVYIARRQTYLMSLFSTSEHIATYALNNLRYVREVATLNSYYFYWRMQM